MTMRIAHLSGSRRARQVVYGIVTTLYGVVTRLAMKVRSTNTLAARHLSPRSFHPCFTTWEPLLRTFFTSASRAQFRPSPAASARGLRWGIHWAVDVHQPFTSRLFTNSSRCVIVRCRGLCGRAAGRRCRFGTCEADQARSRALDSRSRTLMGAPAGAAFSATTSPRPWPQRARSIARGAATPVAMKPGPQLPAADRIDAARAPAPQVAVISNPQSGAPGSVSAGRPKHPIPLSSRGHVPVASTRVLVVYRPHLEMLMFASSS
jgi:hypothetical protein